MQIKIKQKIYSCRWTAILATCALACQSVVAPNYKKFDSCQGLYTSRVFFCNFQNCIPPTEIISLLQKPYPNPLLTDLEFVMDLRQ